MTESPPTPVSSSSAKPIIDSGSLGEVITLRGVYGKGGGYDYHTSWRNDPDTG